jgi:hypothetical protein
MFDWIKSIFSPAVDLIDELHVSEEEKLKLRNELAKIKSQMHAKTIDLMKAEASSEHTITAIWRPVTSIALVTMIVCDGFGFIDAPVQVYDLTQVFLGVYGGGRALEKISKSVKK